MVVPEPLRWLLTAALAGTAAFHLGRAARPRRSHEQRIAESLHAVMGLAMVAMLWPFGRVVPASAWPVLFAGSAGWFAAQASRESRRRIVPVYFMSSAAAMVWMSTAMPATPETPMPMEMPGMGTASRAAAGAIGGCLVLAGLCWLLSGLRLGALRTPPVADGRSAHWPALCHGIMGVSMGLTMLTLI